MLASFVAAVSVKSTSALAILTAACSCSILLPAAATALLVLATAIITYEVLSRPAVRFWNENIDVNQQSEEVSPGVRRRRYINGQKPQLDYDVPHTSYDLFTRGMRVSSDGDCVGWREVTDLANKKLSNEFTWLRYSQVRERAHNLGSGLIQTGLLTPGSEDEAGFVGIYAKNSLEWIVAAQACGAYRLVIVPLYDTLGSQAIGYVLNQTRLTVIITDTEAGVENLLNAGGGRLKVIVCIKFIRIGPHGCSDVSNEHLRLTQPINTDSLTVVRCRQRGIRLLSFPDVMQNGANEPHPVTPAQPDDLFIICYTSGTTGDPKGVMVTHRAITIAVQLGLEAFLPLAIRPQQPVISYLPLAHMYEHWVHLFTFANGGKLGLFSGDVQNLANDMQVLQPAMMPMVPRIMNRVYQKTVTKVHGNLVAKTILRLALFFKVRETKRGYYRRNSIWDYLVFRPIQKALGADNVVLLTITSAPIARKVIEFASAALGVHIWEGYGQTESGGAATCTIAQDDQPGLSVGPPLGEALIKLIDVSELDYSVARDGVGEILIQSPTVMRGYFRDEQRTREAIDEENWLHTGDVGRWTDRGTLQIVDRKKHLFKLAQGEYVAPEKVENVLVQCRAVNSIFVDGDPLETYTVAVVAPDMEHIKQWQAGVSQNVDSENLQRLCAESVPLRNYVIAELTKFGKRNGLNSYEIPKRILLVPNAFTVNNGLLTPTLKLKRPEVRKKYKQLLQDLYKQPEDAK